MDEVKEIAEFAKQFMLKAGYHAPMVFAKGTNGKIAVELKSLGATADKRVLDMLNTGTCIACKQNVGELELIVFVNEAWMGTNVDVLPSLDPKRTEVLLINSLDARTQEESLSIFEIVRNPKGTVIDLKDSALSEQGSVKGKLLPAFQKGYQIISPVHN